MKRISDVQKALLDLGINIPKEKVRKYANEALFNCNKDKKKEKSQRSFSDKQFQEAVRNILLVEFHCPKSSIIANDKIAIKNHLRLINQAIDFVKNN